MSECKYNPETCDIYKEFNDDLVKAQAEHIEKLEKLVSAVKIEDNGGLIIDVENLVDLEEWYKLYEDLTKEVEAL